MKKSVKISLLSRIYDKIYFLPLILIILTFFLPFEYNLILFTVYLLVLIIAGPYAFKRLNSYLLWIFLILTIVLYPMTEIEGSILFFDFINYHPGLMKSGFHMAFRAIMLITAFSLFANSMKNSDVNKLWQSFGIENYEEIKQEVEQIVPIVNDKAKSIVKQLGKKSVLKLNIIDLTAKTLAELLIYPYHLKNVERTDD